MSFFELDCECGGYTSHAPGCRVIVERKRVQEAQRAASAYASDTQGPQYRYRGRVYRIVIQARSPIGPVTLETVDEPRETIETTNDRLLGREFEPVSS